MTRIHENGATSGIGVLATFAYDQLGRRSSLTRGSGLATHYGYDAVSRPSSIAHNFGGNGNDIAFTMAYNPASQIVSCGGAHNFYIWTGHGSSPHELYHRRAQPDPLPRRHRLRLRLEEQCHQRRLDRFRLLQRERPAERERG